MVVVKDAVLKKTQERPGHGLLLEITLDQAIPFQKLKLDVQGQIWNQLPSAMKQLASFFLPVSLWPKRTRENAPVLLVPILTHKLSHATTENKLVEFASQGDHPLLIEIFKHGDSKLLLSLMTKPSLLLKSFRDQESSVILEHVSPEGISRRSTFSLFDTVRWILLPTLFSLLCIMVALNPQWISSKIPAMFDFSTFGKSIGRYLPPLPTKMSEAWDIALIYAQIQNATESQSPHLFEKATNLLQRTTLVTRQEMDTMRKRIVEFELKRGLASQVWGFVSFVNVIWFVSILGIAVSIGPSVWKLLRPFRELLQKLFQNLWEYVIQPFLTFCHNNGIFEFLLWSFISMLLVDSTRSFQDEESAAVYVALTSLALSVVATCYSTLLHGLSFVKQTGIRRLLPIAYLWVSFNMFFSSIHFHSSLLGYLAVICLYCSLGFSVVAGHLCIFIGFTGDLAIHRCIIVSSLFLLVTIGFQVYGVDGRFVQTIRSPISVFGGIILHLALLVKSAWSPIRQSKLGEFIQRSLIPALALLITLGVGKLLGLEGMANSSMVFICLFIMQKIVQNSHRSMFWPIILILSTINYFTAVWLYAHPQFLLKMFSS